MSDECNKIQRNTAPTDAEIDKIIKTLRRCELKNKLFTDLYGCSHLELDEDMTGEMEVIRFVFKDKPSLDIDLNWFRQLCYDLHLTPDTFEVYVQED